MEIYPLFRKMTKTSTFENRQFAIRLDSDLSAPPSFPPELQQRYARFLRRARPIYQEDDPIIVVPLNVPMWNLITRLVVTHHMVMELERAA